MYGGIRNDGEAAATEEKSMKARVLVPILALTLALAACATVEGAGRDISGAARTVGGWMGGG